MLFRSDDIVERFIMEFEANIYSPDAPNIWKQKKDGMYIMEVKYKTGYDTSEYICDINTNMDKKQAEYWLLRNITDKYKEGKIRFDSYDLNPEIDKGTFETNVSAILTAEKEVKRNEKRLSESTGDKDTT